MNFLFNNHHENKHLYLYSGGYESTVKGHIYGPTVRSGYMLHYVHSGSGIFTSNNKKYHLKEGDFFFIEPNKIIKYEASENTPWAFYWIGFRGDLVDDYSKRTSISSSNPVFDIKKALMIKNILSEIVEITLIKEDNDLLLNVKLLEILYHLSVLFPNKEEKNKQSKKSTLFTQALQYIRNNFESNIGISEVANSLAIDRTYLHRLFKQELGISPKEYLTKVRISKAQDLLVNTNHPIMIIAQSVGYDDAQQFSKIFKQNVQMTPTQYRQSL
ncbi:AraC family transcriptional regulator [Alkalibacterium sp. f15]|uniref:AraC family transcriptional regulator n=1 Tax=Alkalibacterium sp. f15 TaxID=3414029 RepID=UPI003BF7B9B8